MTPRSTWRDLAPGPGRAEHTRSGRPPASGRRRQIRSLQSNSQRAPYRSTRIGAMGTALQHSGLQGHEVKPVLFDLLVSKQKPAPARLPARRDFPGP